MKEVDGSSMEIIAKCGSMGCPTIYVAGEGSVVVQGYTHALATPEGEQAVMIPSSVLLEAAEKLRRD